MFFVVGNPRSGTSLLRLMLTNHPEICVPPECGFIQWWGRKYADWSEMDAENRERVDEFVRDLKTSRKIETWSLDFVQLRDRIIRRRPTDYIGLCRQIVLQYAEDRGRTVRLVGDKNNYYVNHLAFLTREFPEASYLCLVRDGRDVACSYRGIAKVSTSSKYRPVLPTDIEAIAEHWRDNNMKMVRYLIEPEKVNAKVIRFRDLVEKSRDVLESVCKWLGVEFDPVMLEYADGRSGTNDEPQEFLAWKKKTRQAPDPSVIGRFRERLTPDEIARFESIAGSELERFGFDLETRK
ncbi:MAG: sulfotransferase [Acidobacteriota bacterium]|nr:MAG: sulfotransferase [Acidobacteriota bacterium]